MFLAYPLLCLMFALQNPALTSNGIPFHRKITSSQNLRFWMGEVESFPAPTADDGHSFVLQTPEGLYRATLPRGNPAPPLGTTIALLAREKLPEPPANPGQRDAVYILRGQGQSAVLEGTHWNLLKNPSVWKSWLTKLRSGLGKELEEYIPRSTRPLVEAALLNDTRNVSIITQQDFTRSGMQHVLAISGQHIGLLVAFLLFPALCLRLPRKSALILAGLLTVLYIPVTGSSVSVVRAGLMMSCFLPSILLERPSSGINALCLAAAVDLIASPFHILNLGFQLSYAATLALILCAPAAHSLTKHFQHRLVRNTVQMIFLSAMVSLFTYPLLAASTHAMPLWGVIGNLITIPISSTMLIGGLCTWVLSPLPLLAHWSGACTGLFSMMLESSVHFLAQLPGSLWPIAEISRTGLAVLIISVLTITTLFRLERWRLGFMMTGIFITFEIFRPCLSAPFPGEAHITVLSVGHGDASVLELPGATILIDAGPSPGTALQVIIPFLQSRGIHRLDAILLTHPDMDHYGGMFGLMDRIPVGFILSPHLRSSDAPWECLKNQIHARGIPWKEGSSGDLLYQKGGITLRVLGPDSTLDSASDNNHSLVCMLQTSSGKALFTGDIEGPAQQALAATWPLWRGAWLKAPHHGSDRTTLPCFLTAVDPPQVAISSGHRPGFPGPTTVKTLAQLHSNAGITSRDGAVIWNFRLDSSLSRKFRLLL